MEYSIKELQLLIKEILRETIKVCNDNGITYYCQAGTVLGAIRHNGFIPWDNDADIIIPNCEIDRFVECAERDLPEKYYVDYYKVNPAGCRQFPRIGIKGVSARHLYLDVFRLIGLPDSREEQLKMVSEAREYTKQIVASRKNVKGLVYNKMYKEAFLKLMARNISYPCLEKFDLLCSRYPYESAVFVMNPSGKYKEKNIFKKEVYGKGLIHSFEDLEVIIPEQHDFYLRQYYGDYMSYPEESEVAEMLNRRYEL